jgi:hypothetical protein
MAIANVDGLAEFFLGMIEEKIISPLRPRRALRKLKENQSQKPTKKLKAKSQKPKAKSQKPRAKSQKPRAKSQKPRAKSQKPKAKSQEL